MLQLPGHWDAGDASLATPGRLLPTDLGGMQRIYDGAIDIGALEADWRPRFAAASAPGCSSGSAPPAPPRGLPVDGPPSAHGWNRFRLCP